MLVRTSTTAGIARVTLDRPSKRNALSPELCADLRSALRALAADDAPPRALVLEGAGPAFCAGGDLEAMRERAGKPHETACAIRAHLNAAVLALVRFPAPTIAAVHGAAIGAGLGLALACDHIHTTDDARLLASQTSIGLAPDGGTSYFLLKALGERDALDLLQTGRALTGREAAGIGLVNAAHADAGALGAAVGELALQLAARPTRALVLARRLVRDPGPHGIEDALEMEAVAQSLAYGTEDLAEGVAAALGKRAPAFKGR